MERYLLRLGLFVMCASCNSAGLPSKPLGDANASVTFHISNASTQTVYVDTTDNNAVGGFDIGPTAGCGCTCGQCSTCESCTPATESVRGLGAGESFDVVISGQVWTWGNGCGTSGCASPSAAAKGLTATVTYSSSYTSTGESPTTINNGPTGEFSGGVASPTSTAQATFDYPQVDVVNIVLR
jgi:hypothetical protein